LLNLIFIGLLLRKGETQKEKAQLFNFLSSPVLSRAKFNQKLNKIKVTKAISNKSFCTVDRGLAIKFFFNKKDSLLHVYLRELFQESKQAPFPKKPAYTVPYLITNDSISWTIPLPGKQYQWRVIPFLLETSDKIYFKKAGVLISQEGCQTLTGL
jgi:hypothetical protein